ncbi:hypothetical protein MMC22_002844 [Lobaria immixta]|nr:hypothetical protein [Lobaria immixta]
MRSTYAMLSFTALALAFPIPKYSPHNIIIPLDRASIVEPVYEILPRRDHIAATTSAAFQAPPKITSLSSINTTGQVSVPTDSPNQPSLSLPQQPHWGPGDISNVLFGCVASGLGAIAVGLTYCLYRRQVRSQQSDESVELSDIAVFEQPDENNTQSLEGLPPAYTSVDASASSPGQQGTESPVTPQLQG